MHVVLAEKPGLQDAHEALRKALEGGETVLLACRCVVDYRGRASSKLTPGDRIVMVKQDGSILVHRPYGYEPVNWQPPGSIFSTSVEGGELLIRAVRPRPREELVIRISEVHLLACIALEDEGEFFMYGDEQEIRDVLAANPGLIEEGLELVEKERRVATGSIDILCRDREGRLTVVEVKRGRAGVEAVAQLKRYVSDIERELGVKARGILVADGLSRGVRGLLDKEGLEFKKLNPRSVESAKRKAESLARWIEHR